MEAGTRQKGDVFVVIEESDKKEIVVKSKLERLYGDAIRETVKEMTREINSNVKIIVEDYGALDWVLRARLEAAVRKYGGERI